LTVFVKNIAENKIDTLIPKSINCILSSTAKSSQRCIIFSWKLYFSWHTYCTYVIKTM